MRNGTRAPIVWLDSLEEFEKFLRGKPFRAPCMAGWVLRDRRGKHLEGPMFSMDKRVCGAAGRQQEEHLLDGLSICGI